MNARQGFDIIKPMYKRKLGEIAHAGKLLAGPGTGQIKTQTLCYQCNIWL